MHCRISSTVGAQKRGMSNDCRIRCFSHQSTVFKGCDLSALLETMQEQFSREPPVYAKPKDIGSANSPSTQTVIREYPGRPPPPFPTTHSPPASPNSVPLPPVHNARPTLPPKPGPSAINFSQRESSIQPAHPSARVQLPLPIHSVCM
jgi:ESCRT-I complex subunit TSG101